MLSNVQAHWNILTGTRVSGTSSHNLHFILFSRQQ
jgi:hypothetical protein